MQGGVQILNGRTRSHAPPIVILGVPFDNVTTAETVQLMESMVASRRPHYLVTANVDFLAQALHDVELHRILTDADLVLCDGTPLVWASRLLGNPLPERVAGSDLVPLLIEVAARKQYRIFLLGGGPGATEKAVDRLQKQFPNLLISGQYSPPYSSLLEMDHEEINRRIREAKPDLLLVAFGCPKQEKWMAMHYRTLGVPVCVGVGATIDFLAGNVTRAPKWMRTSGLEWVYRLAREPRRLYKRYAVDLSFFGRAIFAQWWRMRVRRLPSDAGTHVTCEKVTTTMRRLSLPSRLDIETVYRQGDKCERQVAQSGCCIIEAQDVEFVDSTGIGLLVRLQKRAKASGSQLIFVAPSIPLIQALRFTRLNEFFKMVETEQQAMDWLNQSKLHPLLQPPPVPVVGNMVWQGELTAANAGDVWKSTEEYIRKQPSGNKRLCIDLTPLEFIDSTGLGVMVRAKKRALEKGFELKFIGVCPRVANVLKMSKMDQFLVGAGA